MIRVCWPVIQSTAELHPRDRPWWLARIATTIGLNLCSVPDDFDNDGEFFKRGGRWGARDVLGEEWMELLYEMNQELVVLQ